MDASAFVRELQAENDRLLERLRTDRPIPRGDERFSVRNLLRVALRNELEATELAALWIPVTPEIDVKLGFAQQAGDEAKHYRLIEQRLRGLGDSLEGFDPLGGCASSLFRYLTTLPTTVERLAAGQFTREAIALVKNDQFIELCETQGDSETARLYREVIQPDETFHHRLGGRLLEKHATTPDLQDRARAAGCKTLELAEELAGLALEKTGLHHTPGC